MECNQARFFIPAFLGSKEGSFTRVKLAVGVLIKAKRVYFPSVVLALSSRGKLFSLAHLNAKLTVGIFVKAKSVTLNFTFILLLSFWL